MVTVTCNVLLSRHYVGTLLNLLILNITYIKKILIGHFEVVSDAPQIFCHRTTLKVPHQGQYASVSLAVLPALDRGWVTSDHLLFTLFLNLP